MKDKSKQWKRTADIRWDDLKAVLKYLSKWRGELTANLETLSESERKEFLHLSHLYVRLEQLNLEDPRRPCSECFKYFYTERKAQSYCSAACRLRHAARQRAWRRRLTKDLALRKRDLRNTREIAR